MHRRITARISSLLLAASLIAIAAACSSSTAEPTSGNSTGKKDSGKSSSTSSDDENDNSKKDSSESTDDDTDPKNCSGETTAQACVTCCGYNDAIDNVFAQSDETYIQCACEGTCGSSCGTFCTDPNAEPSDQCIDCLNSQSIQDSCGPKAEEVCNKDAACKAYLACEDQSGCLDKPMPDGGQ
jgi:hypothetical protein